MINTLRVSLTRRPVKDELARLGSDWTTVFNFEVLVATAVSSIVGVGISYSGWQALPPP